VRRFVLAIIVAVLAFSASGVSALIVTEPCTGYEQTAGDDGACPPMCVTCGCCAQAAEAVLLQIANVLDIPLGEIQALVPDLTATQARDILHVPKPRLA
jgi:hypothetical protein